MQKQVAQIIQKRCRKNERGAALITVLLVSFLLIVAVAALLLEASMNSANVTDATAEEQAYYAAESGIQSVVNVLRHNTTPNPLVHPTPTNPANKLDYFKAVKRCISNASCDCATSACVSALDDAPNKPRLSRWLTYDATYTDRVILGDPALYTPQNGFAFNITIEDPDNTGGFVAYNTTYKVDGVSTYTKTWTDGTNTATITYYPYNGPANIDVSSGLANTDFGRFQLSVTGPTADTAGVAIPAGTKFAILVNMTTPFETTKVIRGTFEPGTVTTSSVGNFRIFFDSQDFLLLGSSITLSGGTLIEEVPPASPTGPFQTYLTGYRVTPNAQDVTAAGEPAAGATSIKGSITAPEPIRLLIRSTGYGPHGAVKQLEAVIQKSYFNGLGAPSPLTLIGPPCTPVGACTPTAPPTSPIAPAFIFNPGTSNGTIYSGKDIKLKAFLPPIGVTNTSNIDRVNYAISHPPPNKFNGAVFGTPTDITDDLPFWLQSPKNLDKTLQLLKATAEASGKYYGPGITPPTNPNNSGNYGNHTNATGITYIDGNLEFSGDGGGILVVTGGLTFSGGFNFKGLVVVTGAAGISRTGGGSGTLKGNMIVAPYNSSGVTCVANNTTCFLAPRYDISGGGSSGIFYDSSDVANGLGALTSFVKGVSEK